MSANCELHQITYMFHEIIITVLFSMPNSFHEAAVNKQKSKTILFDSSDANKYVQIDSLKTVSDLFLDL